MTTGDKIEHILTQALQPRHIEVIDESHLHAGHAGAQSGKGHYRLRIQSDDLTAQSSIAAHKQIYGLLANLMRDEIHALSIELIR